jgi:hypothetical protein
VLQCIFTLFQGTKHTRGWFGAFHYLLCLFPGPIPTRRPQSIIPSRHRPFRSGRSGVSRSGVFPVGELGRSRIVVRSASLVGVPTRPSDRGHWFIGRIMVSACCRVSGPAQMCAVAMPATGKRELNAGERFRERFFLYFRYIYMKTMYFYSWCNKYLWWYYL